MNTKKLGLVVLGVVAVVIAAFCFADVAAALPPDGGKPLVVSAKASEQSGSAAWKPLPMVNYGPAGLQNVSW